MREKTSAHCRWSARSTDTKVARSMPVGVRRDTPTTSQSGNCANCRTAAEPTKPEAPAINTFFFAMSILSFSVLTSAVSGARIDVQHDHSPTGSVLPQRDVHGASSLRMSCAYVPGVVILALRDQQTPSDCQ